jgi:hypothetical protein
MRSGLLHLRHGPLKPDTTAIGRIVNDGFKASLIARVLIQ